MCVVLKTITNTQTTQKKGKSAEIILLDDTSEDESMGDKNDNNDKKEEQTQISVNQQTNDNRAINAANNGENTSMPIQTHQPSNNSPSKSNSPLLKKSLLLFFLFLFLFLFFYTYHT